MTPEKVKCWNCMVTFDVGEPGPRAEQALCEQRGCRRPYWSAKNNSHTVVHLGVRPADADRYTPVHMPGR